MLAERRQQGAIKEDKQGGAELDKVLNVNGKLMEGFK